MVQKDFLITRVVTRDFVRDWFAGIRNMFGLRLKTYEKVISDNTKEMLKEMRAVYNKVKWYRISFNPLIDGSIMLNLYGVYYD